MTVVVIVQRKVTTHEIRQRVAIHLDRTVGTTDRGERTELAQAIDDSRVARR